MDGGEHTGERLSACGGFVYTIWAMAWAEGSGDLGFWRGIWRPPFGQSFPRPAYIEYIATRTENTKNPKNPW